MLGVPVIEYDRLPLSYFTDKLNDGEPFTFSRWGDGEWRSVLYCKGQNCDGHQFFPLMRRELRNVLRAKPQLASRSTNHMKS